MSYRAPVTEMRFLLDHVLGAGRLAETERFAEATGDMVDAILNEAARLAEDVLAPLRRAGDLEPARLENGVVRTSGGFSEAYKAIADGGWVGTAASPEFGGMGLEGAVRLGYRNELAAIEDPEEREATFQTMVDRMYEIGKAVNVASHFEIDDVIDPADTRRWISAILGAAPAPAPRHGKKRPHIDTW